MTRMSNDEGPVADCQARRRRHRVQYVLFQGVHEVLHSLEIVFSAFGLKKRTVRMASSTERPKASR